MKTRWVWHTETFASLMLGRIQLAQISYSPGSDYWYWTLFFCKKNEKSSFATKSKSEAMSIAELHARDITNDTE